MTVIITGSSFGSNCPTFQFPSVFAVSTYMTNACTDATVTLSFTTSGAGSGGLVLNSGGYGGQGFEPVTMGGLKSATVQAQSNLPASLSWLPWDILSTPQAAGSPVGGTFSFLQTNLNSGDATVLRFAPGEPATANPIGLSLLDPAASGGNTTAGALSSFTLTYQAPSRNLTKASGTFKVATFGISCYISTSENDYWNGSSCSTLTAYGVTLSGTATPPGLSGSYCQAFLDEVLINGSGVSRSGQDIASPPGVPYTANQSNWALVYAPIKTASGVPPVANSTIAVDTTIIPFNTRVTLDSLGSYIAGHRREGRPAGDRWLSN